MKPIGPLMWEHRRIERMILFIRTELQKIIEVEEVEQTFIDIVIDFFHMYAGRTHQGKEDILFSALQQKDLAPEHRQTMERLIQDHATAAEVITKLINAKNEYAGGDSEVTFKEIVSCLQRLIELYPRHMEIEDKHFFYPCMQYFNDDELDKMLEEFWELDRQMIHEKYENVITGLEPVR